MSHRHFPRALFILGSLLLVLAHGPRVAASQSFVRGDAGGGGALDISDAVRILGYLFLGEAEPACLDAADANDSGQVDIADPSYILQYLFLGGAAPAAPFPACGEDATGDALGCGAFAACPNTPPGPSGPVVSGLAADRNVLARPQGDDVFITHFFFQYETAGSPIEALILRKEAPGAAAEVEEILDLAAFGLTAAKGKASFQVAFDATSPPGTHRFGVSLRDGKGRVGAEAVGSVDIAATGAPVIAIERLEPAGGEPGEEVVLRGRGLGASGLAGASVAFAGAAAQVLEVGSDWIRCVAPEKAVTGPIMVSNRLGTAYSAAEFVVPASIAVRADVEGAVLPGQSIQLTAELHGVRDTGVIWQVNEVAGGSASIGKIDASGRYTAPAVPPAASVKVRAVSRESAALAAGIVVILAPAPPVVGAGEIRSGPGGVAQDEEGRVRLEVPPKALGANLLIKSLGVRYPGRDTRFDGLAKGAMPVALIDMTLSKAPDLLRNATFDVLLPMRTPPGAPHLVYRADGLKLIDTGIKAAVTDDGLHVRGEIDAFGSLVIARAAGVIDNPQFYPVLKARVVPPPVGDAQGRIEEGMTVPVLVTGSGFFTGLMRVVPVPTRPEVAPGLGLGPVLVNPAGTKLGFTLQIRTLPTVGRGQTEPVAFRLERLSSSGAVIDSIQTNPNEFVIAGLPELIASQNASSRLFTIDGLHIDKAFDGSDGNRFSELRVEADAVLGIGKAVGTVAAETTSWDLTTIDGFQAAFGVLDWGPAADARIFRPENHLVAIEVTGPARIDGTLYLGGMRGGENPLLAGSKGAGLMGGLSGNTLSGGIGGDGGVTDDDGNTHNGYSAANGSDELGMGRFGSVNAGPGAVARSNVLARGGSRFLPISVDYGEFVGQVVETAASAYAAFATGGAAVGKLAINIYKLGKEVSALNTTAGLNGAEGLIVAGQGGHGGESGSIAASLSEDAPFHIIPNSGGGGGSGGGSSQFEEELYFFNLSTDRRVGGGGGGGGGSAGALRITSGCDVVVGADGKVEAAGGRGGFGEPHQWLGSPGGGGGGGAGGMVKLQAPRVLNQGSIDLSGGDRGGSIAGFHGSPLPEGHLGRVQVLDGVQAGGIIVYGGFSDTLQSSLHGPGMKLLWPTGRLRWSTTALPFLTGIRGVGTATRIPLLFADATGLLFLTDQNKVLLATRPDYFAGDASTSRVGEVLDLVPLLRQFPGTRLVDICQDPMRSNHFFVSAHTPQGTSVQSRIFEVDFAGDLVGTVLSFTTSFSSLTASRTHSVKDVDFLSDGRLAYLRPSRFGNTVRGVYALDLATGASTRIVADNDATFASMSVLRGEVKDVIHVVAQDTIVEPDSGIPIGHQLWRYGVDGNRITEAALVYEALGGPGIPGLYRADGSLAVSRRPELKYDGLPLLRAELNGSPLAYQSPAIGSFSGRASGASCFESLVFGAAALRAYGQGGLPNQSARLFQESSLGRTQPAAPAANSSGEVTADVQLEEGYNTLWLETADGGATPPLLRRTVLYIDGAMAPR